MYDIRCTPWILKFERKITQVEAFYGPCHRIFNPCKFNLHSKMICILNLFVRDIPGCMTYVVHPVIIVNLQLAEEAARVSYSYQSFNYFLKNYCL
jgi:hypothetical protein